MYYAPSSKLTDKSRFAYRQKLRPHLMLLLSIFQTVDKLPGLKNWETAINSFVNRAATGNIVRKIGGNVTRGGQIRFRRLPGRRQTATYKAKRRLLRPS